MKFNEAQDKYEVIAEYQGSYNDSLLKFTSSPPAQRPDVIHINEIGTATLLDLGAYYPVQRFIDSGDLDISEYMTNVLNAYHYQGQMYAFPFSITVPAIFYNQEAFEKAGIDPETLRTYEGFAEPAKAGGGWRDQVWRRHVQDTWIYEQLMATAGKEIVDNANGRQGRAERLVADENGGLELVLGLSGSSTASLQRSCPAVLVKPAPPLPARKWLCTLRLLATTAWQSRLWLIRSPSSKSHSSA